MEDRLEDIGRQPAFLGLSADIAHELFQRAARMQRLAKAKIQQKVELLFLFTRSGPVSAGRVGIHLDRDLFSSHRRFTSSGKASIDPWVPFLNRLGHVTR